MKIARNILFIFGIILGLFLLTVIINRANNNYVSWEDHHTLVSSESADNCEIFIDLSEHILYFFKDGELIKKYPVAGGKEATPSPYGIWKVVDKGDWGKWFGGYWLGINVSWGRYGIHGTTRPHSVGHSASHGCIRMYNKDVEELWKMTPIGSHVIITRGPYTPFGIKPRDILPGDRGTDVMHVQLILKKMGLYKGPIDGIYGDGMKSAVFSAQKKNGIEPHNEIDQLTLKALGVFRFE